MTWLSLRQDIERVDGDKPCTLSGIARNIDQLDGVSSKRQPFDGEENAGVCSGGGTRVDCFHELTIYKDIGHAMAGPGGSNPLNTCSEEIEAYAGAGGNG